MKPLFPVKIDILNRIEDIKTRNPQEDGKPEEENSGRWEIKMNLVGKGCPRFLRGQVTPEWSVTDLDVGMPDPPK